MDSKTAYKIIKDIYNNEPDYFKARDIDIPIALTDLVTENEHKRFMINEDNSITTFTDILRENMDYLIGLALNDKLADNDLLNFLINAKVGKWSNCGEMSGIEFKRVI